MSNRPDSFMPFYTGDWLRAVTHLTPAERDAYMLLIIHYWDTGKPLVNDDARLARIALVSPADWDTVKVAVKDFFKATLKETLEVLLHERVEKELAKAEIKYRSRKAVSDKGNEAKAAKRNREGNPQGVHDDDLQGNLEGSQPQPHLLSSSTKEESKSRGRAGVAKAPATPSLPKSKPGWEADYPLWAKVREQFGEVLWVNTFARCRPNGSPTSLICESPFDRDRLETQYSAKLERLLGEAVTFKIAPQPGKSA